MFNRFAAVVLLVMVTTASAQSIAKKPAILPGAPTKGFAVAVMLEGLDYTRPDVAIRLARDGEGDAIAYDAVDDDRRPFAIDPVTSAAIANSPTLIVPIRIDPASALSLSRAFAFLRRSPARVVLVLPSHDRNPALLAEISTAADRLIILPADATRTKLTAPHVLTIAALPAHSASPVSAITADLIVAPAAATREAPARATAHLATNQTAALAATSLLTCIDLSTARNPADVIKIIVSKAAQGAAGSAPLIAACPEIRLPR